MDITTNYAQMLTDYQNQLQLVTGPESGNKEVDSQGESTSFETVFTNALDKIETTMTKSSANIPDLITGDLDNLHTMMIDMTEAQLTVQSAVQVRNKVVEAYNDVKNMQF
ncbi:flagellar hook-basal body complex protein FliE [Vagococcus sp. BWB3-3]|uniref:Flagellar hook-basal body complex protein FliE n=1 Tax=Vagococcus allomyrinae TaxID=2794353 RepID=A0A940P6N7_9ENTE|nr:flagellar hook-basal body complex protein FliE [Vagococcus allomyrinae]MBP1042050.1 flagellar hook-basal body complex protein FliE [Vagococcus allomyrinae]